MKKIFIILICLLIANTAFAGFRSPLKVMKQKYGIHKDAELIKIQSYYADDYLEIIYENKTRDDFDRWLRQENATSY